MRLRMIKLLNRLLIILTLFLANHALANNLSKNLYDSREQLVSSNSKVLKVKPKFSADSLIQNRFLMNSQSLSSEALFLINLIDLEQDVSNINDKSKVRNLISRYKKSTIFGCDYYLIDDVGQISEIQNPTLAVLILDLSKNMKNTCDLVRSMNIK